ncbi:MAG: hypothetical protein KIT87_17080 [Anaerolineae bacterium]|nr:hypothetical protein [Anaerolineae bacterium]
MDIVTVLVGVAGVVATLVGVIVAWRLGRRAEFALAEWLRDLRVWASEVIDVLSEAAYSYPEGEASKSPDHNLNQCIYRLSALIDRGRFFLPNQRIDEYRTHRPLAYRGFRHSALDPLVAAIKVLEGQADNYLVDRRHRALIELRKEFVSEIHRILKPDVHNQEIAGLIRSSYRERKKDFTAGSLLPDEIIPGGAEAVLWEVVLRMREYDAKVRAVPVSDSTHSPIGGS